jgi:hypothetical protein
MSRPAQDRKRDITPIAAVLRLASIVAIDVQSPNPRPFGDSDRGLAAA